MFRTRQVNPFISLIPSACLQFIYVCGRNLRLRDTALYRVDDSRLPVTDQAYETEKLVKTKLTKEFA